MNIVPFSLIFIMNIPQSPVPKLDELGRARIMPGILLKVIFLEKV